VLCQGYANPASQHQPGQHAHKVLEDARERIAAILGADLTCPQADRLIFTAGGTEANNLAVLGIARARGARRTDLGTVPIFASAKMGLSPLTPDSKSVQPQQYMEGSGQIIISAVEHQSVIEPAEHLLEQGGDWTP